MASTSSAVSPPPEENFLEAFIVLLCRYRHIIFGADIRKSVTPQATRRILMRFIGVMLSDVAAAHGAAAECQSRRQIGRSADTAQSSRRIHKKSGYRFLRANSRITSVSREWIVIVWPTPSFCRIWILRSQASCHPSSTKNASSGQSFSRV